MKWRAYFRALFYLTGVIFFSPRSFTADFIDIQAELETINWGWRGEFNPPTADPYITRLHCIVGTNSWMITTSSTEKSWWHAGSNLVEQSWWYTGTNLIWRFETPNSHERRKVSHLSDGVEYQIQTIEFDGNVEGGVGRAFLSPQVKIAWLAFCSGPFLKREKREVPMPNDFWKETWLSREHRAQPDGFKDQTLVFDDELGLPRSMDIFTAGKQRLMEYRIRHLAGPMLTTTNVLGWEVPLEFYLAQFLPGTATNTWELVLTAKGTTTSVTVGKPPQFALGPSKPAERPGQIYGVSIGPAAMTTVSNSPSGNKVRIALRDRSDDPGKATFTVWNDEPEAILGWNVRLQVPSAGWGIDGFGWDTVFSDYPDLNGPIESGRSGELPVKIPEGDRWRVCLLYSKRVPAPLDKSYQGSFEIISEELLNQ